MMNSRGSKRRHLAIGSAALVVLVVLTGLWWSLASPARAPMPAVSYTLLDGRKADLAALRGQVVLVNFWATSCATCVREMPQIVATHEKYAARGYTTLAVAMSYDPPVHVANFAQTRKLPFGVVIDNTGEVARRFGDVELTPTTFLLDKQGRVVKRYVGEPDFGALHTLVEKLLAEPA